MTMDCNYSDITTDESMVVPISGRITHDLNVNNNHDKNQSGIDTDQDILQIARSIAEGKAMSSSEKDKKSKKKKKSKHTESESDVIISDISTSSSKKKKKKHKRTSVEAEMGYFSSNSECVGGCGKGLNSSGSKKRKRLSSVPVDGSLEAELNPIFPVETENHDSSTARKKKKHKRSHSTADEVISDPERSLSLHGSDEKPGSSGISAQRDFSIRTACPAHYTQLQGYHRTKVCYEDFDDEDIEFYVCQVPAKMDVGDLHKQLIDHNGHASVTVQSQSSKKPRCIEVQMLKQTEKETSAGLTVIARSREDSQLHVVKKPVVGRLVVRESVGTGPYTVPEVTPKPAKQLPEGLICRHIPFGHVGPDSLSQSAEESEHTKKKKKKKKKKHKHKDSQDST